LSSEPDPAKNEPVPQPENGPIEAGSEGDPTPPQSQIEDLYYPLGFKGRVSLPHNRLSHALHLPDEMRLFDPRFLRSARAYLIQAALAALAILAVLLFRDSLSDAALIAALGASVVIIFLHPSNRSATHRSLIGGHAVALIVGSIVAIIWFSAPVHDAVGDIGILFDVSLAASLGLVILIMAITDTEHPPGGGTLLGTASQPFTWEVTLTIIGAVLLLAAIQHVLSPYLRDLV
jgi:CBS-domain-containing membrane protein